MTSTFLDARALRRPHSASGASAAARDEDIETVIRGAGGDAGEELVIGARYDSNPTGAAVLLGLARVLAGIRFARTVRLVAFADGRAGAEMYARRLRAQHIPLRGMISLDSVGFVVDRLARPSLASRLVSTLARDVRRVRRRSPLARARRRRAPRILPGDAGSMRGRSRCRTCSRSCRRPTSGRSRRKAFARSSSPIPVRSGTDICRARRSFRRW